MTQATPRQRGGSGNARHGDRHLLSLGKLHFLAAYCPLHRRFPAAWLARIFVPAVNCDSVRFFENDDGDTCAALIWARLSDAAAERMLSEGRPPAAADWAAGENLWFLDLLAPFGHGRVVARHIARNPPPEPFRFARIDAAGKLRKVVRGDVTARPGERLGASAPPPMAEGV
ncbi:MAG: toxin-activating lysine-acyltransferase [Roseovarius sp.]|nr:toxin-activating lysine-acyltransferase [Roseovarius sp.]